MIDLAIGLVFYEALDLDLLAGVEVKAILFLPEAVLLDLLAGDLFDRAAAQFGDLPCNALAVFLVALVCLGNLVFGTLWQAQLAIELHVYLVGNAPFAADGVHYLAHLRH